MTPLLIQILLGATAAIATATIGLLGWALNRSVGGVDRKLDVLTVKLEALSAQHYQHGNALVELRLRTDILERAADKVTVWREDITGFLQRQGFSRRAEPK